MTTGKGAAWWGLLGFSFLFFSALYRLWIPARQLEPHTFSITDWSILICGILFMGYVKGHCIFYRRFAPHFAAHPYSSWERESNENCNSIIRRFIPKGSAISKHTHKQIQKIEDWINNYPRKILDFNTAEELFKKEFSA